MLARCRGGLRRRLRRRRRRRRRCRRRGLRRRRLRRRRGWLRRWWHRRCRWRGGRGRGGLLRRWGGRGRVRLRLDGGCLLAAARSRRLCNRVWRLRRCGGGALTLEHHRKLIGRGALVVLRLNRPQEPHDQQCRQMQQQRADQHRPEQPPAAAGQPGHQAVLAIHRWQTFHQHRSALTARLRRRAVPALLHCGPRLPPCPRRTARRASS